MPTISRTSLQIDPRKNPGPYEAIVRAVMDPNFQGALKVELLKTVESGQTATTGQIIRARYLNPFYGVTPVDAIKNDKDYRYSQSSYGMWFVPPDVGNRVMVIFVEGNIEKAYWFGCIQQEGMNIQLPDGRPSTLLHNSTETGEMNKKMPVVEYNKAYNETSPKKETNHYLKPVQNTFKNILQNQGLLEDETRGLTSSSARREAPSSVFGISTPGPIDKDFDSVFKPTKNKHFQRKGGSSIVMDDGDANFLRKGSASNTAYEYVDKEKKQTGGQPDIPFNELVRLRTRTGHQILLHNSEDLIYIGNSKGTTWIEMTANGKIDIFANDSVSVHSKADLNFNADRDVNIEAGRNVNVKSNSNTHIESANYEIKASANGLLNTGANLHLNSGASSFITTGSEYHLNVGTNNWYTLGGDSHTTKPNGGTDFGCPADPPRTGAVDCTNATVASTVSALSTHTLPDATSIMKRVPQHEPWGHHENLNPDAVSSANTDRDSQTTIPTSTATSTRDPFYLNVYVDPEGRVVGDF